MAALLPLAPDEVAEVDRFLADPPHLHLYLRSRLRRPETGEAFVSRSGDAIRGVAWFGTGQNLVLAGRDAEFAREAAALGVKRERNWVMLLGPWEVVSHFLAVYLARSRRRPRLDRSQPFLALTRETLSDLAEPELALATEEDLLDLTVASARMSAEDFEIDPFRIDRAVVRRRMARKIRDGRAYVYRRDGYLAFKADLAVREPEGGQVEGVYTAEDLRGKGIASRCMAEIGRRELETIPELTLHVSAQNAAALKAYERAGFVRVGELRLTIFPYLYGA